jgi:hypothetical protein
MHETSLRLIWGVKSFWTKDLEAERRRRLSLSQAELDAVADRLNTRPRKTLHYQTPAAMLAHHRCVDPLNPPLLWGTPNLCLP